MGRHIVIHNHLPKKRAADAISLGENRFNREMKGAYSALTGNNESLPPPARSMSRAEIEAELTGGVRGPEKVVRKAALLTVLGLKKMRGEDALSKESAKDSRTGDDFPDAHLIERGNVARFFAGPYSNQISKCISDLKAHPGDPACRQALQSVTHSAFHTQYVGDTK